jgi:DNA-binding CsgD family transcriptional regulator
MPIIFRQEFGPELGILQRLGTGRSIDEFQQNLLAELRSVLQWDHAIPTDRKLFTVSGSGLWYFPDIPCKRCRDWCEESIETELMRSGLLLMLNLRSYSIDTSSSELSSSGVLFLRRDRIFEASEVQTLSEIQKALQALLDQSNALDRLIQQEQDLGRQPLQPASSPLMDSTSDRTQILDAQQLEPQLVQLGLTPRQAEVIHLMMKGKETSSIALDLGCREATVRKHLENLYRRLGVQTRTAAIAHILGKMGVV